MQHPEMEWADIVKNGMEFIAEEAASNPTGMDHTRPYVELINKQTTGYLA